MAAVSEDRTPPLSPPHCHSTNNSTTVCCGATPQHHHTGALPGEEEVRRVKNTDIQFATTITHCVMCHVISKYSNILQLHETYKWYTKMSMVWKKEIDLWGFTKEHFLKPNRSISFFHSHRHYCVPFISFM